MKGLLLFFIAIVLFIPLTVINVLIVINKYKTWKSLDLYFYDTAVDIDKFGNHNFRTLFNKVLILKDAYRFGNINETISSVLGKNERDKKLTITGKLLVKILNLIDKDHCKKSIFEI